MNSFEMAEDYLKRSGRCLGEAENALKDGDYPMAIRRSQECIELTIKGILRAASIEFPREHDVSDALINAPWKEIGSPGWFIDQVEGLAKIMQEITPKREPAMYGFIFPLDEGMKATTDAGFVLETCKKFL